ncbi:UDP-N-acetylmuramoyl-tripeptide--D-alanyl-D-alanine ligase [Gillisia limnaea]|uniref:UDP-N-acetylmuramoyl-tripeptide--D-alanyl-D-alanine ligase n=1 Tax=Gillisia limnaea (strain DSM 15749 / LMG 21470 / R-8282) TaxID=865937 RepID=H2BYY4_GILLR|nr:UDP-N-acetylmuramoyl-tripeptide--D-alanyl-D-alanine ligase [Gillisia limnaea]EHQ02286.1 UDP-N-acetylmuramoyl-tripeptide--D-alanyl-D-alanine ligase [Gillisia limnaea DSM 15749]
MKIEKLHKLFLQSNGIATDTRILKSAQLFFALKGENFDGNKFVDQALEKGAGYVVLDDPEFLKNDKCILVSDVLETLQQLASYHRKYLGIPILAITGSNGKTTSKELINLVLSRKFNTVATAGNLNNHIGVPLSLLSMNSTTEFGIIEMGANHAKEIERLCGIAQPDYGYITNFGKAHLEGFGSIEGVVKAKSELYEYVKAQGKLLFLNADDPIQQNHVSYKNTFSFGTSGNADVVVEYKDNLQTAEVIQQDIVYKSTLTGSYNSRNIAAAICIGLYFKIPAEEIANAIACYNAQNNRSQIVKLGAITLLMDAYNANPTSMTAALESFHKYPAENKTVILGDMFELGETSAKEHQEIVNLVETMNFNRVFLVGSNFNNSKCQNEKMKKFENFSRLAEEVKKTNFGNSYILVKGSRGMALERILDVLE